MLSKRIGFVVVLLLAAFSPIHTVFNDLWSWHCDFDLCVRVPKNSPNGTYPSAEVCRLVCGKFSSLWPRPTMAKLSQKLMYFCPNNVIFANDAKGEAHHFLQNNVDYFQGLLNSVEKCTSNNVFIVNIKIFSDSLLLNWKTNESYTLEIHNINGKNQIITNITSPNVYGARHGLETLLQLITIYEFDSTHSSLVVVNNVKIVDSPIYSHRGLLLDSSRNYLSIPIIKDHIRAMAASKMNVLHWHITDSQSFPLELATLPKMSEYGAYSRSRIYRRRDVQELIAFARHRGVRILFEIDAPAHAGNGWQWGPEAGLGNLTVCYQQQPWRSFCIEPPCGQLNPVNPNVYVVLQKLYAELLSWLPEGETLHMGGDEVFIPCWNETEEIVRTLGGGRRTVDTFLALWAEFQRRALDALDTAAGHRGLQAVLWTSHLTNDTVIEKYLPNKERYIIQTWVPSTDDLPQRLIRLGYELIVSTKDAWYLDHGFWGRTVYHDWRTVYNNRIPAKGALGGEVCMWGEYVDDAVVTSRTWPRAAAAAERLWADPGSASGAAEARFYHHRERLVGRGIRAEAVVPRWCFQSEGQCNK